MSRLLHGGVTHGADRFLRVEGFPLVVAADHGQTGQQHWMDDEAVVIIPVQSRAVAVGAVADVPFFVVAQARRQPFGVVLQTEARRNAASMVEANKTQLFSPGLILRVVRRASATLARTRPSSFSHNSRGARNRPRAKERRIDQRLLAVGKIHAVR